jgi:hypothetical protein
VQFTLRQDLRADVPASSVTLLVPHAPGPAADLAGGVRVLRDEAGQTVVDFPDAEGVRNLVALNASDRPVRVNGFATDAEAACVRHRQGKVLAAGKHGGKELRFAGEDLGSVEPRPQPHAH